MNLLVGRLDFLSSTFVRGHVLRIRIPLYYHYIVHEKTGSVESTTYGACKVTSIIITDYKKIE